MNSFPNRPERAHSWDMTGLGAQTPIVEPPTNWNGGGGTLDFSDDVLVGYGAPGDDIVANPGVEYIDLLTGDVYELGAST